MSTSDILAIVTCVNSALTLVVVTVAFLPQVKQVLAVIRDVVLWTALVLVLAVTGWTAWSRLSGKPPADPGTADSARFAAPTWSTTPASPPIRSTATYRHDL